jgi:hypothetical protein
MESPPGPPSPSVAPLSPSSVASKNEVNAIFMLCFKTDHYVLAACMAAFVHRRFIKKLKSSNIGKIDLVIMCDSYIYETYGSLLSEYFDRVLLIQMRYYAPKVSYTYAKEKYSIWIGLVLNKYQALKYVEYDKILFTDVDVLPCNIKLYDIFQFNTPAVLMRGTDITKVINNTQWIPTQQIPTGYDAYLKEYSNFGSMDGGFFLMSPNLELYNKYEQWTNQLYKSGIYSTGYSAPEETSMFYFMISSGIPVYNIATDYVVVPWDAPEFIPKAKSYNFLSFIKPWTKPRFLCWHEELLWHTIYKSLPENKELRRIHNTAIFESINIYLAFNPDRRRKYYNQEYLKRFRREANEIFNSTTLVGIQNLENMVTPKDYGIIRVDEILALL